MKKTLLLLLTVICHYCLSQVDTIYYDSNWEKTTLEKAMFYRLAEKGTVLWNVKDFYISGKLQMEGKYSTLDPDIQEGYFKWYYESGQKYAEGNFEHGQRDGLWTFWFPDGLKKEEISFARDNFLIQWRSKRIELTTDYHEMAEKMIRRKRHEQAIVILNAALEINPYDERAFFERGRINILLNNNKEACNDFRRAREYMYYNTFEVNEMILTYCD